MPNGHTRTLRLILGATIVGACIMIWLSDSFGVGQDVDPVVLALFLGAGLALVGIPIERWKL